MDFASIISIIISDTKEKYSNLIENEILKAKKIDIRKKQLKKQLKKKNNQKQKQKIWFGCRICKNKFQSIRSSNKNLFPLGSEKPEPDPSSDVFKMI